MDEAVVLTSRPIMSLLRLLAAAPDLALGVAFLVSWIAPNLIGPERARLATRLMLLEFIVVHSAVFVGYLATRHHLRIVNAAMGLGVSAAYALFVWVIVSVTGEMWMFWSFAALTANRLMTLVVPGVPDSRRAAQLGTRWVLSTILYIVWIGFTTIVPIPAMGLDSSTVGFLPTESGLWVKEPQRVVVAAAGYFFSQAYLDLRPPRV